MSIGLYDADIMANPVSFLNLEIMKLSAYYKRKGEIVVLSPIFTPERNTTFFYRKDYDDGNYPSKLYSYNNLLCGGYAFSDNYIPFEEKVEKVRPDKEIYTRLLTPYFSRKNATHKEKTIFSTQMNAEHCRLSLDGKKLWQDYSSQFIDLTTSRTIVIHDKDVTTIEGGLDALNEISNT